VGESKALVYAEETGSWRVEEGVASENELPAAHTFRIPGKNKELEFRGLIKDDKSLLGITFREGERTKDITVPLWTAEQVGADIYEPTVTAVAHDGRNVWVGIGNYLGEGFAGLGTLLRVDVATYEVEILQPEELKEVSIQSLVVANGKVWMGTYSVGEGYVMPGKGLVTWSPETKVLKTFAPKSSQIVGSVVTAVELIGNALWFATDEGICRVAMPSEVWKCWRIVPTVRLVQATPMSGFPSGANRGSLPPGDYEVRWIVGEFLEIITTDATQGWIPDSELEGYETYGFGVEPYNFENMHGGFPSLELRASPHEKSDLSGKFVRGDLQRIKARDEPGWSRVRACLGWVHARNAKTDLVMQETRPR
jgi:hypothetical protein